MDYPQQNFSGSRRHPGQAAWASQRSASAMPSTTSSSNYFAVFPNDSATPSPVTSEEPIYQWKPYLYNLQSQAPKPKRIICILNIPNKPTHYGKEFHGAISREDADRFMQENGEGSYLVRESQRAPGSFTLGIRCNHSTKNFRLFFDGKHYVADKRFDTLHDLVEDGLITMYVEANASEYINSMDAEPIYEKHSKYSKLQKVNNTRHRHNTLPNIGRSLSSTEIDSPAAHRVSHIPTLHGNETVEVSSYEKAHNFKVYSFGGLNWCEYCGNFMWGLKQQGVKCSDCGLSTHKLCSKKIPNDCMPDMRLIKRMYGIDLTTLVKAQNTMRPVVVEKCIEEIESRGLEMEGIYRIPGLQEDVDLVRQRFDKDGINARISKHDIPDPNAISGALKLYLRQLPIPLVPFELFDTFMDSVNSRDIDVRLDSLHKALMQLKEMRPAHYHTLRHMLLHLSRVKDYASSNLMSAENLSIVFGPTIFRAPTPAGDLQMLQQEKMCVQLMISYIDSLFESQLVF